jgi:ribosome-binding protein aMBF1 (putative translation factor)
MPNIAVVLKDEIRRLARKEAKSLVGVARRAVAQHRREIAKLKRLIDLQARKVALLASKGSGAAPAEDLDNGFKQRFSARSVRAQRRKLGLSAHDYGKLLGVSGQTVYHWEMGKARPRKAQFEQLVSVRGIGRREAVKRLESLSTAAASRKGARRKTSRARRK